MARFLIDEDLPRSTARELVGAGHDAIDVRDAGLRGAADARIHAHALVERRALVTADLGLANPYRYEPQSGTVLVRYPSSIPAPEVSKRIATALAGIDEPDLRGATIVIEPGRIRIRRL